MASCPGESQAFESPHKRKKISITSKDNNKSSVAKLVARTDNHQFCLICEKAFENSFHLKEHLLIHSAKKLYKCESCLKVFTKKNHLTRHTLKHTNSNGKSSTGKVHETDLRNDSPNIHVSMKGFERKKENYADVYKFNEYASHSAERNASEETHP